VLQVHYKIEAGPGWKWWLLPISSEFKKRIVSDKA